MSEDSGESRATRHKRLCDENGFTLTTQDLCKVVQDKNLKVYRDEFGGLDGVLSALKTNKESGLTDAQVEVNRKVYGKNVLPKQQVKTFLDHLLEALADLTLIILVIAATITIIFGIAVTGQQADWIQGISIMLAVIIVSGVTSVVNYWQDGEFQSLRESSEDHDVTVLRNGEPVQISIFDLVVGDICRIQYGDKAPGDGILVSEEGVHTDESALNGESEQMRITQAKPVILGGANVDKGEAYYCVCTVGVDTTFGSIVASLNSGKEEQKKRREELEAAAQQRKSGQVQVEKASDESQSIPDSEVASTAHMTGNAAGIKEGKDDDEEGETNPVLSFVYNYVCCCFCGDDDDDDDFDGTPLQLKLNVLAEQIGYVGLAFGAATFVVLFIRLFAEGKADSEWYVEVVGYLVIGITIVVVAVPEGLPLAVTISLAWSMQAMTRDKSLVRELAACETMGSATAICSDKTGTLTVNRMTVVAGYFFGRLFEQNKTGIPRVDQLGSAEASNLDALARGIGLNCSDASAVTVDENGQAQFQGNRTECALLNLLQSDYKVDLAALRERTKHDQFYRQSFDSELKRMSTLYAVRAGHESGKVLQSVGSGAAAPAGQGEIVGYRLVCKGASEILLELCTKYRTMSGEEAPITDEIRAQIAGHIKTLAKSGLRTLVVAERSLSLEQGLCPAGASPAERDEAYDGRMKDLEKEMTLLMVAGIEDPIRPEVPAAMAACKLAGIRVRMVTGDNIETARKIARECKILTDEFNVAVTGEQYRSMTTEERKEALPNLAVMARSLPGDKLLMVQDLRQMNEVVAVTGDGTNDAPALKEAHVGLSMGITGTEVAKEASKIIILDDNFASIVATVKWGRSVFKNISSFLAFQLAINVSALTITFVIACTNDGSTQSFPITPTQLIYVNLIMDSLGALMLATSPPEERMMLQEPNSHEKPLLTKILMKMVLAHGVWETIVVLVLALTEFGKDVLLVPDSFEVGSREHNTAVFNAFIFMVIWNKLHAAKIHDELDNIFAELLTNTLALIILVGILVLQIIIIEVGGEVFQTVPQAWDQWFVAVAIGFTSVPLGYLVKFIPYYDEYDVLAKTYGFWGEPGALEDGEKKLAEARITRTSTQLLRDAPSAPSSGAAGAHVELVDQQRSDGVGAAASA